MIVYFNRMLIIPPEADLARTWLNLCLIYISLSRYDFKAIVDCAINLMI